MVLTDPVADMISRIRNAIAVNRSVVSVPHSKFKETIARQLAENNFVDGVEVDGEGVAKQIVIKINKDDANARISYIAKVSKPGRREYAKAYEIPKVKNGRGIVIVSTAQGVMTGQEAAKRKIGGELICKVY